MTQNHLPQRKRLPHDVPPWVNSDAVFFVTICTKPRGGNQLCCEAISVRLLGSIRHREQLNLWWVHVAVLMPDHVHLLVSFAPAPGMERVIGAWKRFTSRNFGIVWQDGFFDRRLRSAESVEEKGAYVLENPVRAGFVTSAGDWPYTWMH